MTLARPLVVAAALVLLHGALPAAHEFSRSESKLTIDGRDVNVLLTIDLLELTGIDTSGDARISYEELDAAIERIFNDVKQHLQVSGPVPPNRTTLERYELVRYGFEDEHVLRLHLKYAFGQDVTALDVTSSLHMVMRPDHRHLTSATLGGDVQEAILDASAPTARFTTGSRGYFTTFKSFLGLGIEHIFTGYDHLAFLLGLLIATTTLASLVKVVTSFTLAHSITLALATFNVVVLPTRLTESLIALSIAYVALENLLDMRVVERHRITFLFGLVHGFGFSNVLRDMHLPKPSLALSLFSFNAGVEIGQIAFVALVFPLVTYVIVRHWRQVRPAMSFGVICLGVYWFVKRAFL